jgi:hypothetical protein
VDKNWYGSTSEIERDAGYDTHSLETFSKIIFRTRYGGQLVDGDPTCSGIYLLCRMMNGGQDGAGLSVLGVALGAYLTPRRFFLDSSP